MKSKQMNSRMTKAYDKTAKNLTKNIKNLK